MARRPQTAKKTLSAPNLAALGAERLAELALEMAASDAGWKRRLRMELAAEVGAPDLALEIDKRLTTLATSRARVSWRKRPELIADLDGLRRIIVTRLAVLDARLAFDRIVVWFDLYPGLAARVRDPKGELAILFDAASGNLATLASTADIGHVAPVLGEALQTRLSEWGSWIGRGAGGLDKALAARLLADLLRGRPAPVGRMALVARKLADRAGDLDAWLTTIAPDDRRKPEVGAEIARRLAMAGRAAEARAALDAAHPVAPASAGWSRRRETEAPPPPESWFEAEIAVLESEGADDAAMEARWVLFERTLSETQLRALIAQLADFEDVVALDRAFAHAAGFPDATAGLAFLMGWPALREAADMAVARHSEMRGSAEAMPLWISRLEGRYPLAALHLLRERAIALARLTGAVSDEVRGVIAEALALGETAGEVAAHDAFVSRVEEAAKPARRGWR